MLGIPVSAKEKPQIIENVPDRVGSISHRRPYRTHGGWRTRDGRVFFPMTRDLAHALPPTLPVAGWRAWIQAFRD